MKYYSNNNNNNKHLATMLSKVKLQFIIVLFLCSLTSYATNLGTNTTNIGTTETIGDNLYAVAGSTGLTIQNNATYTIDGNFDLSAATSDFTITVNGGSTLIITNKLISTNTSIKITLSANSSAFIYINAGIDVDNNITFQNDGTIEVTGNTDIDGTGTSITVNGSGNLTLDGDLSVGESTTIMNNGALTVNGDVVAAGTNSTITNNGGGTISIDGELTGFPNQNGTINTSLPIELISFTSNTKANSIELIWATASETNNDYFSIEHSIDGINFDIIETIEGAGNSTSTIDYSTVDYNTIYGTSYYRLKQTDYDGQFAYSDIISVFWNEESSITNGELNIYPNPYQGGDLILSTENIEAGKSITVSVFDINGKIIYNTNTVNPYNQEVNLTAINNRNLSKGMYFISVISGSNVSRTKVIVE